MGVATLQDLATRAAEITADAQEVPARLPDLDDLLQETPSELARTLTHRPMKYRAIVDGSEASDLQKYAGQPLYFVVEKDVTEGGNVLAFSRLSAFKDSIRQTLAKADTDSSVMTFPYNHLTPQFIFYDDANWSGNVKSLSPSTWYPDLTKVIRNVFWHNWNDVISSVDQSRSYRVAWEHINAQGSAIAFQPGFGIGNLTDWGWNDRISSLANYG